MTNRTRVMVVYGGRSGEHEVSLNSARSVLAVLDPARYEVIQVGITHDGNWLTGENLLAAMDAGRTAGLTPVTLLPFPGNRTLYAVKGSTFEPMAEIDVVFPLLHGSFGEDGTLQGLLEMADLPYVGAGVLASAVGMDKVLFKELMRITGIPVLPAILATRAQLEKDLPGVLARAEQSGAYPFFTKPANLGSSVGVTKCRTRSDLMEGLLEAARFDRRVLIERGLEKPREIEISVLGNEEPIASLPGEIVPCDEFYSYRAKYLDERSELIIPAPLSEEQIQRIQELAVRAYRAIDGAGMARVDFLLDRATGECFVSEINTIPGFTRISMFPKLWAASGIPYSALVDRLIALALERKADRDRTERKFGSNP